MIPRSIKDYEDFILEKSQTSSKPVEKYEFSKLHINIKDIPLWALIILTSLSYCNKEKDNFVENYLFLYLNDKKFKREEENKRIVFVTFDSSEEFVYVGSFTELELDSYENENNYDLMCHQICTLTSIYENVDLLSVQVECPVLHSPYDTSSDEFLTTTKFEESAEITFKNKNLKNKMVDCLIDTGASITSFFYPENWNREKGKFIETGLYKEYFEYLNKIKKRVEYLSFNGNLGEVFKQIVFFKEDIIVNLKGLKLPLRILSIPAYNNSKPLIAMDFIRQCILMIYESSTGYNMMINKRYKNIEYLREKSYEEGIIFGYNDVNRLDVFEYKSDVKDYNNCRLYKNKHPIRVIEVDSRLLYTKYKIHLYHKEKREEDSHSLIQELYPSLNYFFKYFDAIRFEWSDEIFYIFKNPNYFLKRLNIIEILHYEQNDIENYLTSSGLFYLNHSKFI